MMCVAHGQKISTKSAPLGHADDLLDGGSSLAWYAPAQPSCVQTAFRQLTRPTLALRNCSG